MARQFPVSPLVRRLTASSSFAVLMGLAPLAHAQVAATDDEAAAVTVVVTSNKNTGSEADGYRVSDFGLGPLGDRPALDTPYAVQTVPQDLIQNQGVTDNWELLKYLPSTQIEYRGGSEVGRPQSRGFEADLLGNTRIDGFAVQSHIPQPIEMTDHIDVLSGLSGALYGPMNPAGVFNYVLKRPTETTLNRVGLAYQSDGNLTTRADLGGRAGKDNMFGYRLNVAHTDGETFSDTSNLRREVASLAVDARLPSDTVLEASAGRYVYDRNGYPGSFSVATGASAQLPDAGKLDQKGYSYDWAGVQTTIDYYTAKLTHHFNQDWKITGGLMRQNTTRVMRSVSNTLSTDAGSYRARASEAYAHWELTSNQLYLNGRTELAGMEHELTFGTNGYVNPGFAANNGNNAATNTSAWCDIGNTSCAVSPLNWKTDGGFYRTGTEDRYQTAIIGDTVTINDQWSVLGVVSNGWITAESTTPAQAIDEDDALSYTGAVMYKPRPDMTVYLNYASSVLPGERAPSSGANLPANAGQPMDPYEATQWEMGYKVELSGLDVNVAAFHIKRPTAYAGTDNVYRVQGQQRNQGLELMTKGKLTDDITIFGGVTWLDTKVSETDSVATEGKQAIGVPEWQANLLTEYKLPESLVPGTTASLNLHYTGERAANAYNTAWADGYTTVDIGLRFSGEAIGRKLTARLGITNLFDERYWASIMPSNVAGDSTTSGSSAFLGEPRTFKASVSMDF